MLHSLYVESFGQNDTKNDDNQWLGWTGVFSNLMENEEFDEFRKSKEHISIYQPQLTLVAAKLI